MQKQKLPIGRNIFNKVGVIGSGIMGSGIAAQLVNAGVNCLLLDLLPKQLSDDDKKHGLAKEDKIFRNKISTMGLNKALHMKPAQFFSKRLVNMIEVGNLYDDFNKLSTCDWIIEVIVENIDVKRKLFEKIEKILKPTTIVSSNTSGLSVEKMIKGRSEQFKKHFLVTHFFNPVRYLHLLEIVKSRETSSNSVLRVVTFAKEVLGKGVVYCKDTTNFIANRIGIFAIMETIRLMKLDNYSIEEVDAIFGLASGRPKSAIFRTADIVGLDIFIQVAKNCYDKLKNDEQRNVFKIPEFFNEMLNRGLLGEKTKQGFYKKEGKEIKVLDLNTMNYRDRNIVDIESLNKIRSINDINKKIKFLNYSKDRAGNLSFNITAATCIYAANRLDEISDDIIQIDNAMKWGFGWKLGPFEIWDAIGVETSINYMLKKGYKIPNLIKKMLNNGQTSFYDYTNGVKSYYDFRKNKKVVQLQDKKILKLDFLKLKSSNIVKKTFSTSLIDLGDGILSCEFHTKMNAIDDNIIKDLNVALDLCESGSFNALILANDAQNFSVGANIFLLYMAAKQSAWDQINKLIINFQNICKRLKYSNIPTVAAPFQLTLGGGAELALWCNRIRAYAELYMGLVEVSVGLIPAGGGNVEMLYRTLERSIDTATYPTEHLIQRAFEIVAMAKVSTSAVEATDALYMNSYDGITMNRNYLLKNAKYEAYGMAKAGFIPPNKRTFRLPGYSVYSTFKMVLMSMCQGNFISSHDLKIAKKIAYIMTGGKCTSRELVTEQYLLDLEREAFLSLISEKKSQDRIEFMLKNNRALRN